MSSSFQTNEEIVDDLTKDLKHCNLISKQPAADEEIVDDLTKDLNQCSINSKQPTAKEEILDDLTKDLSQCSIDSKQPAESSEKLEDEPEHSFNSLEEEEENDNKPTTNAEENEEEIIDEESLQERDAHLSTEEKENFLQEALKYKNDGNTQFKEGDYLESIITYTKGLRLCPLSYTNDRSILFANRAASKQKLGRKESAIQDCTKAVELNSSYLRAILRRAVLYEETEKLDESLEDYKKVLELDPTNKEAYAATLKLPSQINERNEKMKAEMMDKLKDLGNMVLRPFGLSTNNFQMVKDPNTGGYSINFVQNR
ncbi:tetratricopeptide repeat protein 1 [Planococcus citri]|uniref:tetratricopeptide repeat protein 1 n=1 Tax=Planococcus citri TaxID=170843 RepID=UPI0031F96356